MWQTYGHDNAIQTLSRALAEDRVAHSWLIAGPAQVGKTTLALDLARAVNCVPSGDDKRPCGACRQCSRIASGMHPDIRVVGLETARSGRLRTLISIEQVRDVQRELSLLPYEGASRVVIFESAELFSAEAANSLLKTLEEPPERVLIILLASDAAAVLPTILSRCRQLRLKPSPASAIARFLTERKAVLPDDAREIAGLAAGRIGWAVNAAEDPRLLERVSETLDGVEAMLGSSLADRFDYAEKMAGRFSADRKSVYDELELWQSWWRDALLAGQGRTELAANVSRLETVSAAAERLPAESLVAAIKSIRRAEYLLRRNVTPRLAIESMMLALPTLN